MAISVVGPRRVPGSAAALRALVRLALASEKRRAGEIAVVLSDDTALRALNLRWRRLDRATDVLSFGYDEEAGAVVHGDVIVSLDRSLAQARRFRVTPGRELGRLVVHGALHLAGLDHQRPAERRHMRAREDAVLRAGRAAVSALERVMRRSVTGPAGRARSPRARA